VPAAARPDPLPARRLIARRWQLARWPAARRTSPPPVRHCSARHDSVAAATVGLPRLCRSGRASAARVAAFTPRGPPLPGRATHPLLPLPTMAPTATLAVADGVAVVTLANPPVNALHPDGA